MRPQWEILIFRTQLLQGPAIAFPMLLGNRWLLGICDCVIEQVFATAQAQPSALQTQHPELMNRIT